jgi:WD40 repeat protein
VDTVAETPFPSSALNGFKADFGRDYPVAERAFEDLVARELTRLTSAVPPGDLAIQWEVCYEARDMGLLVRMANHAVASSGRTAITSWTDPGHGDVEAMAFSPDGTTLATGDAGGTAYLWNVASLS